MLPTKELLYVNYSGAFQTTNPSDVFVCFALILYVPVTTLSFMSGEFFYGWTADTAYCSNMQHNVSDGGDTRTSIPSISSVILNNCATELRQTALLSGMCKVTTYVIAWMLQTRSMAPC